MARLAANDQLVLVRLAGEAVSVLLLTSAGHAPGVSALGVALALTWPEPVLLVDADREPDQTVLGRLPARRRSGWTRTGRVAAGAPGAASAVVRAGRDDRAAGRGVRLPAGVLAPGDGVAVRPRLDRLRPRAGGGRTHGARRCGPDRPGRPATRPGHGVQRGGRRDPEPPGRPGGVAALPATGGRRGRRGAGRAGRGRSRASVRVGGDRAPVRRPGLGQAGLAAGEKQRCSLPVPRSRDG